MANQESRSSGLNADDLSPAAAALFHQVYNALSRAIAADRSTRNSSPEAREKLNESFQ